MKNGTKSIMFWTTGLFHYWVAEKDAVHKRNTSLSGPAIRTNTTPGNRLLNSGKQLPMQSFFTNDLSRLNFFCSPFHSFCFFNKNTVYPLFLLPLPSLLCRLPLLRAPLPLLPLLLLPP